MTLTSVCPPARKKGGKPSASTIKCLFGAPDRRAIREELHTQLDKIHEADTRRWGFDFGKEEPVNDRDSGYVWEKVTPLLVECHEKDYPISEDLRSDGMESDSSFPSPGSSPTIDSVIKPPAAKSLQPKQTILSEYYPTKKRSSSPLSEERHSLKKPKRNQLNGDCSTPTPRTLSYAPVK